MTTTTFPFLATRPDDTAEWVWDRLIVFATADEALAHCRATAFPTAPNGGLWAEVFEHAAGFSVRHMLSDRVSSYLCQG
jgi:hypothetical protein